MENAILWQLYSFAIYLISGMIIGVFFDIFRILRKSFHTPDFVTYIEDIIFWLLTGFFLLFILFKFNNGEIRIYNIIGLLIGGIFYLLSISKFFIKINVFIVNIIKKIFYKILKILSYPILLILKILRKIFTPFTFFVINIKKTTHNCMKKMKISRKKKNKIEKIVTDGRILERNVEKYK